MWKTWCAATTPSPRIGSPRPSLTWRAAAGRRSRSSGPCPIWSARKAERRSAISRASRTPRRRSCPRSSASCRRSWPRFAVGGAKDLTCPPSPGDGGRLALLQDGGAAARRADVPRLAALTVETIEGPGKAEGHRAAVDAAERHGAGIDAEQTVGADEAQVE